jgi:hypothetical protein
MLYIKEGNLPKDYRILKSAFRHGITETEIDYVLSDKNPSRRFYEMHDDRAGNAQDMVVGYSGTRPYLIEVSLCYSPNENIVFHAAKITRKYRKLYEAER